MTHIAFSRHLPQRKPGQRGQAILLVLVAMSLLLLGALGFAIDGAQMYAQREMAQAAADAAAQAGIASIYTGTNATETTTFGLAVGSIASCTTPTDGRTPCAYAQRNGFNTGSDTVKVDFIKNGSAPYAQSPTVNQVKVTITRTLNTTLLRFLGPATSSIKATATAAMVNVPSPTPIIVTHPTASGALSVAGSAAITICGGPNQSIQVNSSSLTAVSINGNPPINLTHAGPLDPGDCSAGTGGDFGVFGGPVAQPSQITVGASGSYIPGSLPIPDPLGALGANVAAPTQPGTIGVKTSVAKGVNGCAVNGGCSLYKPGYWAGGLTQVKNETALFSPGIYFMDGSGGFSNAANGIIQMATGLTDGVAGTNTGWTGNVLFYLKGTGVISLGANSNATLVGSPSASAYKGILFFEDRAAGALTHTLGGGGAMSLSGTIYLPSANQALTLGGGGGSSTLIAGEIIVGTLSLGGNSSITMNLNANPTVVVQKIALVN